MAFYGRVVALFIFLRLEVCDTVVYRFNEEKTLTWIATRFERIKAFLIEEGTLHKGILSDGTFF